MNGKNIEMRNGLNIDILKLNTLTKGIRNITKRKKNTYGP